MTHAAATGERLCRPRPTRPAPAPDCPAAAAPSRAGPHRKTPDASTAAARTRHRKPSQPACTARTTPRQTSKRRPEAPAQCKYKRRREAPPRCCYKRASRSAGAVELRIERLPSVLELGVEVDGVDQREEANRALRIDHQIGGDRNLAPVFE